MFSEKSEIWICVITYIFMSIILLLEPIYVDVKDYNWTINYVSGIIIFIFAIFHLVLLIGASDKSKF